MSREYSAYGKWHVTTEGDCEGRSVRDLGVFEGYLDEIAFALGSKAYYALRFSAAKELPKPEVAKPVNEVQVSLDIDSGTWDSTQQGRVEYFRKLLAGRKVAVKEGTYYASVLLVADEKKAREITKRRALEKLTDEEKEVLGLKNST